MYNKGKNQHSTNVVVFYLPQDGIRKVGFTATKKIGNAVKRNRAKRRMRALFREFSANLQDGSYIFVAKAAIVTADYQNIQNDFKKILSRSKTLA
ncbi:ribonuclease P protein component [Sulfurimonas sp. C5]|nr:ribonuclease P protein component [Sulfurimonas sp. C5]MDH4945161.1 ribonuclease P protein component [Sulfurimonas sp. C5]